MSGPCAPVVAAVRNVGLAYWQDRQWSEVLFRVSLDIRAGEIVGLVGESGCGKSSLALLMLGYRHPAARVRSGEIWFDDRDLLSLPESGLACLRGNRIGFVPQNPTTSLNPGMRVGAQIAESLRAHGRAENYQQALPRILELFEDVGLPGAQSLARRYPHELSGGQQQRVTIAMALACGPDLVVLDEPTTGLDVTTQEQIINLLKGLRGRHATAMLYVTNDLSVLAELADRINVMYAGHVVESAPSEVLFAHPRHPYTRGLIGSIPRLDGRRARDGRLSGYLDRREIPAGCPFQPRCALADEACPSESQSLIEISTGHRVACRNRRHVRPLEFDDGGLRDWNRSGSPQSLLEVSNLSLKYGRDSLLHRLFPTTSAPLVVRDIFFTIDEAEVVALVGESGSGKSTIARAISGLLEPASGRIIYRARELEQNVNARLQEIVRNIQFIFQNPDASLNPRQSVRRCLARPLEVFFGPDRDAKQTLVDKALQEVTLSSEYAQRFPDQLSGGERQRVAIARALIADPELLLCDEILSALDVSVQADILDLLERLRQETSVAMLFISHDLAVVRRLADRVIVLYQGQIMETGPVEAIFTAPFHPYTLTLLMSVPGSHWRIERPEPRPEDRRTPEAQGCAFAGRCSWKPDGRCFGDPPPLRSTEQGLSIRCHLSLAELREIGRPPGQVNSCVTESTQAGNVL